MSRLSSGLKRARLIGADLSRAALHGTCMRQAELDEAIMVAVRGQPVTD